jgi:hypothetical protein
MLRITLSAWIFLASILPALAQDDLLSELQAQTTNRKDVVLGTFKGTRLVNGHSVEASRQGELEFMISHRFGTLNSGGYFLWGLDEANIRLGLDYGITDRLTIGLGRSSADKTYDAYAKYRLLRQHTAGTPLSLTVQGTAAYQASYAREFEQSTAQDAMSYAVQALLARKFKSFSLQLAPSMVHRNSVDQNIAVNTLFALGAGARVKVTRSFSLHAEYYARLNEKENNPYYNSAGIGFDIETGGHVFQLIFTNSVGMTDRIFIAETDGSIRNGDIRFGFNIARTFQLSKQGY